jgi:hypothetical protein
MSLTLADEGRRRRIGLVDDVKAVDRRAAILGLLPVHSW